MTVPALFEPTLVFICICDNPFCTRLERSHASNELHKLLDVRMEVGSARADPSSSRLGFSAFELDLQRVHEPVHEPTKGGNGGQLHDLGSIEVLREPVECGVVISRFVACDQLRPSNHRLLAIAEQRAFHVIIAAQDIQLFFRPSCRSPDQAIVLDSVFAFVDCRNLDHRKRARARVQLAAESILLQYRLKR
jgi:hypothetical protein